MAVIVEAVAAAAAVVGASNIIYIYIHTTLPTSRGKKEKYLFYFKCPVFLPFPFFPHYFPSNDSLSILSRLFH